MYTDVTPKAKSLISFNDLSQEMILKILNQISDPKDIMNAAPYILDDTLRTIIMSLCDDSTKYISGNVVTMLYNYIDPNGEEDVYLPTGLCAKDAEGRILRNHRQKCLLDKTKFISYISMNHPNWLGYLGLNCINNSYIMLLRREMLRYEENSPAMNTFKDILGFDRSQGIRQILFCLSDDDIFNAFMKKVRSFAVLDDSVSHTSRIIAMVVYRWNKDNPDVRLMISLLFDGIRSLHMICSSPCYLADIVLVSMILCNFLKTNVEQGLDMVCLKIGYDVKKTVATRVLSDIFILGLKLDPKIILTVLDRCNIERQDFDSIMEGVKKYCSNKVINMSELRSSLQELFKNLPNDYPKYKRYQCNPSIFR